MKKYFIFALAAVAMASCTNDDFLGEGQGQSLVEGQNGAILFSTAGGQKTQKGTKRKANLSHTESAAALNNNFVVEGIKGDGSTQTEVFDHYNVLYTASTANTTESNTKDWEYVGVGKHGLSASSAQTIKYWDYAATQYDFVAFSYGKSDYEKAVLTEIDYTKLGKAVSTGTPVYTVTGGAEELAKTYIADLVTVYNRDGVSEYGTTVTPVFRSMGTKIRLAFYETVPGYSVKNLKFYTSAWDESTATATAGAATPTIFAATAIFPSATTAGTMSVYYPTVGWANSANATLSPDYNQAHVSFAASTEPGEELVNTKEFGALANMAAAEGTETAGNIYLGRSSNAATYAGDKTAADHAYQIVLPLGTKDNLQIRVEYDLVPIDGGAETIHVRDARAVVPAAYADWKPNYAYTYIFKISDNTNGWTGVDGDGDVVEGLTPITFDAVVANTEDGIQETITTVATPSITTYQKGVNVSSYNEYEAGEIYASVMNGLTPVTVNNTNFAFFEVTAGANLANEAIVADQLAGKKHDTGITLATRDFHIVSTVPAADGNTLTVSAAKLTVEAGKTYVFMYTDGVKPYVKVIRVKA